MTPHCQGTQTHTGCTTVSSQDIYGRLSLSSRGIDFYVRKYLVTYSSSQIGHGIDFVRLAIGN